jgi:hypothetical protein
MNIDIVVAIIAGIFGIISGALVTYVGAVLKFRKDLESEYDKDLRSKRIESYKELRRNIPWTLPPSSSSARRAI